MIIQKRTLFLSLLFLMSVSVWAMEESKKEMQEKFNWSDLPHEIRRKIGRFAGLDKTKVPNELALVQEFNHSNDLSVNSVACNKDGSLIVSGGNDGNVKVWSDDQKPVHQFNHSDQSGNRRVNSVACNKDGSRIVSGGSDGNVKVWEGASQQPVHQFNHSDEWVNSVACNEDGSRIVSGGNDGNVKVWEGASQQPVHQFNHSYEWVNSVACNEDGSLIVSGNWEGKVKVWKGASQQPVHQFNHSDHSDHSCNRRISSVACNEDGSRIVAGLSDGMVKVWEGASQKPVYQFNHSSKWGVTSVAWNEDGSRIVSGGYDGTVKVWKAFLKLNDPSQTLKKDSKKRVDPLKMHLMMNKLAKKIHKKKERIELGPEKYEYYQFLNEQLDGSIKKKIEVDKESELLKQNRYYLLRDLNEWN